MLLVNFSRSFSKIPPDSCLKPSCIKNIPIIKIAIPLKITVKFSSATTTYPKSIKKKGIAALFNKLILLVNFVSFDCI